MLGLLGDKWRILAKVVPLVALMVAARVLIHELDGGFIAYSSLVDVVIAANVFILGFLLAGTLADYKESERLPGELASSLETIADEFSIIQEEGHDSGTAGLEYMSDLSSQVHHWFYRRVRTKALMAAIANLNHQLVAIETVCQPQFVARMKQEQANVRRMVTRIDTIRDTQFVPAGYAMAEVGTLLLVVGFLFVEINPLVDAAAFTGVVSLLMIYLVMLIGDLDNPFDHDNPHGSAVRASLRPIEDVEGRLRARVEEPSPLAASG